jgi:transcriptional regulator with XRE-family HTH domain
MRPGRPGPVVRRIQLGSQLRKLRLERGITLQRAGHSAHVSETKMSRMELGRVSFKRRDVENLLTLYGITDEQARTGILSLAEEANIPGWWQQYSDVFPGWWSTYLARGRSATRRPHGEVFPHSGSAPSPRRVRRRAAEALATTDRRAGTAPDAVASVTPGL